MKYADYAKLSKEEKKKVPFSEVPTRNKVAMFFGLGSILFLILVLAFTGEDELPQKPFSQMNTTEKAAWISNYQNSFETNVTMFQVSIQEGIKNKFNFPEEVEIEDEYQILANSRIKNADTGECFNNGYCLAKNAFGVKSKYYWEVNYTLTDSLQRINEINIMPM